MEGLIHADDHELMMYTLCRKHQIAVKTVLRQHYMMGAIIMGIIHFRAPL